MSKVVQDEGVEEFVVSLSRLRCLLSWLRRPLLRLRCLPSLGSLSHRSRGRAVAVQVPILLVIPVGVILLRAFARDVTRLAALVAALASGAKRTAVGSRAVTGDVTQLAARVTLDGLRLAVASVVVRPAALIASSGASSRESATTVASSKASAANRGSSATESRGARVRRVRARANIVAELTAVVAAAGSASAAKAKGRAIRLDVAQALAVVALLGLGGARQRALAGLVIGLFAIVAKSVRRGALLGVVTKLATFVACTTRERRHLVNVLVARVNNKTCVLSRICPSVTTSSCDRRRPATSHRQRPKIR